MELEAYLDDISIPVYKVSLKTTTNEPKTYNSICAGKCGRIIIPRTKDKFVILKRRKGGMQLYWK